MILGLLLLSNEWADTIQAFNLSLASVASAICQRKRKFSFEIESDINEFSFRSETNRFSFTRASNPGKVDEQQLQHHQQQQQRQQHQQRQQQQQQRQQP